MKISPFVFYGMTIREAKLAIKGHKNELHEAYIINLYATTNAVGSCFGGKNYKMMDPFGSYNKPNTESNKPKALTAEDVSFYKAFGIDARDVRECEFEEDWKELSMDNRRELLFRK